MPEYTYECEACEVYFSKVFSREEYDKKGGKVRCPECNKAKKVCRSYVDDNVQTNVAFALSECKTLGHYAEKQSAKYGKYQVEDMKDEYDDPVPGSGLTFNDTETHNRNKI